MEEQGRGAQGFYFSSSINSFNYHTTIKNEDTAWLADIVAALLCLMFSGGDVAVPRSGRGRARWLSWSDTWGDPVAARLPSPAGFGVQACYYPGGVSGV